jgi:histidyl-tRNA synthetase
LGAQDALLGGGRYDGLSEMLGGPPAPGIGFSIGEDRFVLALSQLAESETASQAAETSLFILWLGESAYRHAAELARELRAKNAVVELLTDPMKLKKALELVSRLRVRHALIIGDQELAEGKYLLRDMSESTQRTVAREEIFELFAGRSAESPPASEPAVQLRSPQAEKGTHTR